MRTRNPASFWLVSVLALAVLLTLLHLGARGFRVAPPLGPLLDPANGMWGAATSAELPREATATIPGLTAPVRVVYDDRAVPHIFAATETDAQRALGYVVARDRLFQLELQWRAGAGTLTELVGDRALPRDREMRGLGVGRTAQRKLAALEQDAPSRIAIDAYAEGVNAWIAGLRSRDIPIEYKLLGRAPARWEPINSIHLLHRMAYTLAMNSDELTHRAAVERIGAAAADAVYPVNAALQEPIQPNGQREARLDVVRIPPPITLSPRAKRGGDTLASPPRLARGDNDGIGSNNWVVAPWRTAAGFALLAGDPHLELTLPSIWYEAHLVVGDSLDVYGATIPGAPTIVIGLNRDVAWTLTNTQSDAMDYYRETVDDTAAPARYRMDGEWQVLARRVEEYVGKNGEVLARDTVRYTHRGPLQRVRGEWMSVRWTANETSDENAVFLRMGRARSVAEFLTGSASFVAPAQNMAVVDRSGAIAIRSTGAFPVRPGDGRGDVIRDGSLRANDWIGARSFDRYPRAINPSQGFAASANQQPLDPRADGDYIGATWTTPWRAMRINRLLRGDSAVTPDAMRRWQTDPGSERAEMFVPAFLAAARARRGEDAKLERAAKLLAEWDRRYTLENHRAILFERAMVEMWERLWDELRPPDSAAAPLPVPEEAVMLALVRDSANVWWDDRATSAIEKRDDILAACLVAALDATVNDYGEPEEGGWSWSKVRQMRILHVLGIPTFSRLRVANQGGRGTLSPLPADGRQGASWRMVVEMAPEVRAWGVYPGGQSGNPASTRYADRISKWSAGELDTLRLPRSAADLPPEHVTSVLTLRPPGGN